MRRLIIAITLMGFAIATPVFAGDDVVVRPRLVAGGVDIAQSDKRIELVSSHDLSLGAISPLSVTASNLAPLQTFSPVTGAMFDKLALGGYVAYSLDTYSISSALRNHQGETKADLSASYDGNVLGYQGTTAFTLGYDWHRPASIFGSEARPLGLDIFETAHTGLSVSLSWNHSITPSWYFGGFASAQHAAPLPEDLAAPSPNSFKLGAGLGVKF
jgi:hypothetical protein